MHRLRNRPPVLLLWLLLTSLLLRGALPAGTMLAGPQQGVDGIALVLCSGKTAAQAAAPGHALHEVADAEHRCPYALSAAPVLPAQPAAQIRAAPAAAPSAAPHTQASVAPLLLPPPARGPPLLS